MRTARSILKWILSILMIIGFFVFLLPNLFNFRERQEFSDAARLKKSKTSQKIEDLGDSITIAASTFYKRGSLVKKLLGPKYRKVWSVPVTVKVLDYMKDIHGRKASGIGGGMQTASIDIKDTLGREYTLRSVNKDQSEILPNWLKPSVARFLVRDAAAALNPYSALAVCELSQAAGIWHTGPKLYFVPYDERLPRRYRKRMAGRMVFVEKEPNKSWKGDTTFGYAKKISNTEHMLSLCESKGYPVDTLEYARCRLFDILIGDWDRHVRQWKWALIEKDGKRKFHPIPVDRDIAFYLFDDGLINKLALSINDKFTSFHPEFGNIGGFIRNSNPLDTRLLKDMNPDQFEQLAKSLQTAISDSVIYKSFGAYPSPVYNIIGSEHIEILKARRDKLPEAAKAFCALIKQQ